MFIAKKKLLQHEKGCAIFQCMRKVREVGRDGGGGNVENK